MRRSRSLALLSLVCGSLAFVSCDRHSWEDSEELDPTTGEPLEKGTHRLFLEHGGGHEEGHGKDHKGEKAEKGHAEKKEAH